MSSRRASSPAEELQALRELGCELGQGFYLASPLDLTSDTEPPALRRQAAG